MTPPMTRTQKRQLQTKEKIFRVAMELFRQKGFEATTVADITEAADIGKGTFFTYFPTKAAVFGQLGEMMMETLTEAAEKSLKAHRPIAEVLSDTLTATAGWLEANKPLARQVIRSSHALDADTPNQIGLLSLLVKILRDGQEKGACKSTLNLEDAALALAGIYFSTIAMWALSDQRPLRDRLLGSIDLLLHGILD